MNVTKKIFMSIIILLFINACATTSKVPTEYLTTDTKYAVVAISMPKMDIESGAAGLMTGAVLFGPLGAFVGDLAEEAATREKRDALSNKIAEAAGDWRAEDVLRDKIYSYLLQSGRNAVNTKKIVSLPPSIAKDIEGKVTSLKVAAKWYDPKETVFDHSEIISKHKPDVIIEAGYCKYSITKKGGKQAVLIMTLLKLLRADNGKAIGRNIYLGGVGRGGGRGKIGKFDLRNEDEIVPFVTKFKQVSDEEIGLMVQELSKKLGL